MREHAIRELFDLKSGDHLCCIYETEQEHRELLTPFIRQGLERGEKVLYIVDAHTAEEILSYLREDGVDVDGYLERGQLVFLTRDDAYMKGGTFDPDSMIALLTVETEKALEEGYSALRGTGEMTWALLGLPGSERLMEYEAKLNHFFPGRACLALCQYDRRSFPPQTLLDVLYTHPTVVIGTRVYKNFYYNRAAPIFANWLESLEQYNRMEEDLREREASIREKLNAILEPEGDIGALELSDIIDYEAIQSLMDDFYQLTNIGVAVNDLRGEVLVATGWQDICTLFHRVHPDTRKHCVESDIALSDGVAPGTYQLYRCKNNMWDIATPIIVGGRHMGNLYLGQFFFEDETPDYELFRRQAQRYGFDEQAYLAALDRVPRWSREKVDTVMSFYTKLAGMISSLSHGRTTLARALAQKEVLLEELRESETELRRNTDNMLDMLGQTNIEGIFSYISPSCEKVLGYTPEEMLGHSVFELIHPDDLSMVADAFMQGSETRHPDKTEYRYRHADGHYVWLETIGNPLFGEAEEIVGAIFSSRDVTERKWAEDALKKSEERFRVLSDQSLMGIYIIQGGLFKYVNQATADICGYSIEEIMAWGPDEYAKVIHPDDLPMVMEQVRKKQAGESGAITNYEWRLITKSGEVKWVEAYSKTIHIEDDPADFAMMIDITERKLMEEERSAREEALRDFIDIASHELRHPITILKGYSIMLREQRDKIDEATQDVILEIIEHGADRLNSLVGGLLDISHIERGKFKVEREPRSLAPLIERALSEIRMRGFDNSFTSHLPGDIGEYEVDGEKIVQLLVILLENAVKHSLPGLPIEVEAARENGAVLISVLDRGIGIPEEDRKRIFERFYQVEEVTHHSTPGMGMGLYIAFNIAEAHGGRIWHEPREGGGSVFRFTLPAS